ncbi:hypothetical protein PC129_g99 [Phytophthora cactorum]|uniref:Uncharacterized protein n=1 Tax=Phytophthora cactorum TaxID=29920 RepID=A0A8T1IYB7_9STRA|nr:hypothetical protein PC113_g558 [Phytophthora cactorum]KAG3106216.1 hypothetical protein PC122_g496 [Phytophthora cactorum]KAG3192704.1 hypothetical protein C6341_g467 [Phytophthora cactorum]KAG3205875.1 hypothetical protein PC128_g1098 [Phytophthora cactorum]KAG3229489.1 hypothetical protein PC129_g99 [Phytophthora cactorum]
MTRHAAARPINTIKQYKRTVLDGYNLEDMKALSTFLAKSEHHCFTEEPCGLLARGASRRPMQFPDTLSLSLSKEGPQVCTPLVVIMRKGKTNQAGRVEYGAVMRY